MGGHHPVGRFRFHSVLLAGAGVTNAAAANALVARGHAVSMFDDGPSDAGPQLARSLGIEFQRAPSPGDLREMVETADAVMPAPGLPESHEVMALAQSAGVPVVSEFDLAAAWDERPVLAVTGTNGKTTVSELVSMMLTRSGVANEAVGNLEVPLVAAIDDPVPACFVVEASSFRLNHSRDFAPAVATWLNFAPDHLDVHASLEVYESAKASIFANLGPGDVAVLNLDDPVVARHRPPETARTVGFSLTAGDYYEHRGELVGPEGSLGRVGEMWSQLPHDRLNSLAASATALAGGASLAGVREALRSFTGLPHRVQFVGEASGVRWYDDSKATAPHATVAAASGFERVVLIAGGQNKGLDLGELAAAGSVVEVVAIGASAAEVLDAFDGLPGRAAGSMREAVELAGAAATPGDVVLLSPGCASFDWYGSYSERGDDFTAEVRALLEEADA
jgi:UDP-N-acetylmuramoylalanine--D-glutamate ligase